MPIENSTEILFGLYVKAAHIPPSRPPKRNVPHWMDETVFCVSSGCLTINAD